ncbi:integrase catalytic domain-containing protein [Trichonephila clavipes]|nr:integrase catalytic domain-containing protein [Trichonephila clavipes]
MGYLPQQRVTLEEPFFSCSTDYAGPVTMKFNKGQSAKTTKGYIDLLVCFAIKAFHIEAVSDLTADALIAAFRRFVSPRGYPQYLFSDNGKNFIGFKRKLSNLHAYLSSIHSNEFVLKYLSQLENDSSKFTSFWRSLGIRNQIHYISSQKNNQ